MLLQTMPTLQILIYKGNVTFNNNNNNNNNNTGLLILCDGAISHNRPQIASNRIIHKKSLNSQKNVQYS